MPLTRLVAPAAVVLLGLGASACSGAGGKGVPASGAHPRSVTSARVALPRPAFKADADLDSDSYPGEADDDNNHVFGHPASAADRRAIAALVERYYAAAAAGDGAAACSLLYSFFAESVAEDYGQAVGGSSTPGATCAAVISKLFAQRRRLLKADSATLKVAAVRIRGKRGSVLLSFDGQPPRHYLQVHTELGAWKVEAMLDNERAIYVE
jgi:hypothetical protein